MCRKTKYLLIIKHCYQASNITTIRRVEEAIRDINNLIIISSLLITLPISKLSCLLLTNRHGRQVFLHEEVSGYDGFVLGLLISVQHLHSCVLVQIVEECDGLPAPPPTTCRGVDNLVQRGLPSVIGPAAHEVAQVDDEGTLHVGHVYPGGGFSVLAYLQTGACTHQHITQDAKH
jgi:hypothetical protein